MNHWISIIIVVGGQGESRFKGEAGELQHRSAFCWNVNSSVDVNVNAYLVLKHPVYSVKKCC